MSQLTHRFVETNGIRMHLAEQGTGPLVLLLHGFPEGWYSWRHQLAALSEAGYHAVAPDQRGYGETDHPADPQLYTRLHLVGDVIGLLDALGSQTVVIAGHDWGAGPAWSTALLRPDRVRAAIALSIPYSPRGQISPLRAARTALGDGFYQNYFQKPGVAEAEFERDVRTTMRKILYAWETTRFGPITVTAAPGLHGVPEITYVLQAGGATVYFGGDTLLIPELSEIGKQYPQIDVALLAINGLRIRPSSNRKVVMDASDAAELCRILQPRYAVPIHYSFTGGPIMDTFFLKYAGKPKELTDQFQQATASLSPVTSVRVLAPGEPLMITV